MVLFEASSERNQFLLRKNPQQAFMQLIIINQVSLAVKNGHYLLIHCSWATAFIQQAELSYWRK